MNRRHIARGTSVALFACALLASTAALAQDASTPDQPPSMVVLGVGGGGIACFGIMVVFYNLWALISMMRDSEAEPASGLSKGAWALSLIAWVIPGCGLFVLAPASVIMARMVTGQVYREEASISSNKPASMASINAGLLLVFVILVGAFSFVL